MSNGGGPRVRTALVTGASSGIGLELSRLLVRDGARVVMVARDEERLRRAARWVQGESKGAAVSVVACDLAVAAATAALHVKVGCDIGDVDFLVNNAGVGVSGDFARSDGAAVRDLIQINVSSLVELTRLFLPGMLSERRGRILNVASMAGFLPGPQMSVYYASKAFVLSFSEAVAQETAGRGVTVTALCPGPVPTGFQERAGIGGRELPGGPLSRSAAAVALDGYRGALAGRRVVIPGLANKLAIQAMRFMPRASLAAAVARLHARGVRQSGE